MFLYFGRLDITAIKHHLLARSLHYGHLLLARNHSPDVS